MNLVESDIFSKYFYSEPALHKYEQLLTVLYAQGFVPSRIFVVVRMAIS